MILVNSATEPGQPWVMTSGKLVDQVDLQASDLGAELLELVQAGLVRAPVVAIAPVGDELSYVGEVRAVSPSRARHLVRKARARQPLPQIGEVGVGDVDAKWLDVHGPPPLVHGSRARRDGRSYPLRAEASQSLPWSTRRLQVAARLRYAPRVESPPGVPSIARSVA